MTQPWFGWIVRNYQKEVLDVVEKLGLRMEESTDPDEPGCIKIYVDPPEGYENASILSEKAFDNRDTMDPDKTLHHKSLSQITGSCQGEADFGSHIWFEARRGYPDAYFGKPRPMRVGEVYTIRDYAHMISRHDHWPREGIVVSEEEITAKMNKMFPGANPDDWKCSFMGAVGMIFPDGFFKKAEKTRDEVLGHLR